MKSATGAAAAGPKPSFGGPKPKLTGFAVKKAESALTASEAPAPAAIVAATKRVHGTAITREWMVDDNTIC